jgi:hypothetical protein
MPAAPIRELGFKEELFEKAKDSEVFKVKTNSNNSKMRINSS